MKKLFIVEFGKPESSYASSSLFVVATTYDEAAQKAVIYLEDKHQKTKPAVVNPDGDLVLPQNDVIQVRGVRLASNEVVW